MSVKLPNVSSASGAPMGRRAKHGELSTADQKFTLRRIPINQGGYDSGGAYWGLGQPLYLYESEDCKVSDFIRAKDREDAKAKVRQRYPSAKFFR